VIPVGGCVRGVAGGGRDPALIDLSYKLSAKSVRAIHHGIVRTLFLYLYCDLSDYVLRLFLIACDYFSQAISLFIAKAA
jgi:hypothetical protein